jgi:hypothetical protein
MQNTITIRKTVSTPRKAIRPVAIPPAIDPSLPAITPAPRAMITTAASTMPR